jgi:hypothetical protein
MLQCKTACTRDAVVKPDPMWICITRSDCFRGKTIFKDRNPRRVIDKQLGTRGSSSGASNHGLPP